MRRALVILFVVVLLASHLSLDHTFALTFEQPNAAGLLKSIALFLFVVLPAFLLLKRYDRLAWWHVTIAAVLCASLLVFIAGRYDAIAGPSYTLWQLGEWTIAGFLFWVAAIWRNPRLHSVGRAFPYISLAVLAPCWAAMFAGCCWLMPKLIASTVVGTHDLDAYGRGIVAVQLRDGLLVDAPMRNAKVHIPAAGECAAVYERHSLTSGKRLFWFDYIYDCRREQ